MPVIAIIITWIGNVKWLKWLKWGRTKLSICYNNEKTLERADFRA